MQTPTGRQQRAESDSGYRPGTGLDSGGITALDTVMVPGPGPGPVLAPDPALAPGSTPRQGSAPVPAEVAAPASGPIFVDASGRRRKLARRASLAAVAVLAGYAGLLAVSFAGGPIPPNALLPVPGVPSGRQQAPASSAPAGTTPSGTSSADHVADGRRSTSGGSDHRGETRASTSGETARQSAPSQPQPTTPATTASVLPPTPTGTIPTGTSAATTSTSVHGNPSPPGHTRRQSPSASQSSI